MTETFCDSAAVKLKAGADAETLLDTEYTQLINQAESFINTTCRHNYTDNHANLDTDVSKLLEDAASSYAACSVVSYDLTNFASRAIAQTIIDVNWAKFQECIRMLKEQEYKDFIDGA